MSGAFDLGSILHFHNYKFDDGTTKAKFLILLGKQDDGHCLLALTTSKKHYMVSEPGCTQNPRTYYFIDGDKKNFFEKDTWIILYEPQVMTTAELISGGMNKEIEHKHTINTSKFGHIRNCMKYSDDISKIHLNICGLK